MIADNYKNYESSIKDKILSENDTDFVCENSVDIENIYCVNGIYRYKIFYNDGSKIEILTRLFL
ncbi:hypothetical protein [uncultured Clostridium sp.]|uniref:hypothetical protein n=1 Tax=uncultured Clostridium sp. TaxID=59620 RepID=UPI0026204F45|nr:hypothetical protein [uncultured Clostridium sp.]